MIRLLLAFLADFVCGPAGAYWCSRGHSHHWAWTLRACERWWA